MEKSFVLHCHSKKISSSAQRHSGLWTRGCYFCCLPRPLSSLSQLCGNTTALEVHATNVALSALGPRGPRSAQMVQLYQRGDKCPHTWLTLTRTNIEVAKVNT